MNVTVNNRFAVLLAEKQIIERRNIPYRKLRRQRALPAKRFISGKITA